MKRVLAFLIVFTALLCAPSAQAVEVIIQSQQNQVPSLCPSAPIQICGATFFPQPGYLGNVQTFTLPERFESRAVIIQCVANGGSLFYLVTNGPALTCALRSCAPGAVTICGTSVQVDEKIPVGETIKVTVPADAMGTAASAPPSFLARCSMANGAPQFEPLETGNVMCSSFPCKPTTLNICGSAVEIEDPAPLGTTLQVTTENNQPATVQCVGGGRNGPRFEITDHTCQ